MSSQSTKPDALLARAMDIVRKANRIACPICTAKGRHYFDCYVPALIEDYRQHIAAQERGRKGGKAKADNASDLLNAMLNKDADEEDTPNAM